MKKNQNTLFSVIESANLESIEKSGHPLKREYMEFLESLIDDQGEHFELWMEELGPLAAKFILCLDAWRTREVMFRSGHDELHEDAALRFMDYTRDIAEMWENRPISKWGMFARMFHSKNVQS